TRRKMLGSLLVGAGVLLTACRLTFPGQYASKKGKVLLRSMPVISSGLKGPVHFPIRPFRESV
ncbi:hypothetical protein, partial [Candidatus Brocadia sapporoensis]|uniref:hypothetical protein n=1 Tax=Candidatus Brocadia sapporoensis TaxID=392547 RepID=UPI001E48B6A0